MSSVVLLDPDPTRRPALAAAIAVEHEVHACGDPREAARHLDRGDRVLLADSDAYPTATLLELSRSGRVAVPMILAGEPNRALAGAGAVFIDKPFSVTTIREAMLALSASRRCDTTREGPAAYRPAEWTGAPGAGDGLDGPSPAIARAREEIARFAAFDFPVMILGESGTGKELAAKRIHRLSRRSGEPFVALNCAALGDELAASQLFGTERGAFTGAIDRRGALEEAGEGTLFLDELGEMRPPVQALLLRALEERETVRIGGGKPRDFAARVMTATNADLSSSRMRLDLLARLEILVLEMPPLRERREDIPWLAARFLAESGRDKSLSDAALEVLDGHPWPGNVRELRNVVYRAVVASGSRDSIEATDLRFHSLSRRDIGGRS
ncbi:MAG: sigma-54-dependent Fis family transcriptional regulator [Spirochaetia bacterium]|nr:sigma-54-dependent Fis family transcriptional regulator [Spirochaetia bacterium]